jgi:hypothetical protein
MDSTTGDRVVAGRRRFGRVRPRPGEAGWPSDDEWAELRRAVDGRLLRPTPLLDACRRQPASAACADVRGQLRNPISRRPAGRDTSLRLARCVDSAAKCVRGGRPHGCGCRRRGQLRADTRRAPRRERRRAQLPGDLDRAGSAAAWIRQMRRIAVHDAFVPRGCTLTTTAVPAVSIDAGAMWMDVYDAVTTKAGRCVQGGGCATVGVAGLIQSGGFGSFSKGSGSPPRACSRPKSSPRTARFASSMAVVTPISSGR